MPQSGTLNPPKTLLQISWLCFTKGHILCCEEDKKNDNTFEEKINNISLWLLEIFCLPMSRSKETFKLFFASAFSNCMHNFSGFIQLYHENNGT